MPTSTQLHNGPISDEFHKLSQEVEYNKIISRIFDRDFSVWMESPKEISNRLDWLNSPTEMLEKTSEIIKFVDSLKEDGIEKALLLGMGGSSLAPEVYAKIFGKKNDFLELHILDSTVPEAIMETAETFDPTKTIYIVSTKSGTTVETISLLEFFYNDVIEKLGDELTKKHFVAITDPDSSLYHIAKRMNFRHTFLNNSNIGGRYSALSHFGLVPAAMIGCNPKSLLQQVRNESNNTAPATELGAFLAAAIARGRDKLTLIASSEISQLSIWIEQLVAESTGKDGKGILPVIDETFSDVDTYGNDRCCVYLRCNDSADIYAEALIARGVPLLKFNLSEISDIAGAMYQWKLAIAIVGYFMKIHPFDQPDVEAAKTRTKELIQNEKSTKNSCEIISKTSGQYIELDDHKDNTLIIKTGIDKLIANGKIHYSYLAIQAYLYANSDTQKLLNIIQKQLMLKSCFPTTLGFGPRYLHSTGQLHKGDAGHGLFLQITANPKKDITIPNRFAGHAGTLSFGTLLNAQAQGDADILRLRGRSVLQINLRSNVNLGLKEIIKALTNKKNMAS